MSDCNCPTRWLRWTMLWIFFGSSSLLDLIQHGIEHAAWKAAADTFVIAMSAIGIIGEICVNRHEQ